MKYRCFAIVLLMALLGMGFHLNASKLEKKAEKVIKKFLKKEVTFESKKFAITEELKNEIEKKTNNNFYGSEVTLWKINEGSEPTAFALMDDVEAKSGTITFITLFDLQGKIILVKVIKYRPQYGSEVKNKRWLRKFNGKEVNSSFKDIDAVSGATISSVALTEGIQRLTHLITTLNKQ